VRAGRSLTDLLAQCPADVRGGTQALSFQVLRVLGSAEAARALMAPKNPPAPVDALLVTALGLLWPTDAPPPYAAHTLVDQAVTAARARTPAAANFINAVLRRFLREQAAIVAQVNQQPVAAFNHPAWWIERVRQDWPGHWQALLAEANRHPPMALRVNPRRAGSGQAYLNKLALAGLPARLVQPDLYGQQAIVLNSPCNVQALPGFEQGEVSVQDLSAQRAARLLIDGEGALPPLQAGARVLDACSAPGGKTAHLAERADLDLLALDSDGRRLARVQDTFTRLGLPAPGAGRLNLRAADARQVATWWDGQPFDAILLDAPCTASGIVRRHPDVRWLRRPDDVGALATIQRELLDALWPLVKPGGRLLYATCSLFKAEGQHQIDAFLQRQGASPARLVATSPGHLLPLPDNPASAASANSTGDGFFYALIHKP